MFVPLIFHVDSIYPKNIKVNKKNGLTATIEMVRIAAYAPFTSLSNGLFRIKEEKSIIQKLLKPPFLKRPVHACQETQCMPGG
jgi:hypothetical protein